MCRVRHHHAVTNRLCLDVVLIVEQLKVRKIYSSKARPQLIDCYVALRLSSSFILKRGDDLLMNALWMTVALLYRECERLFVDAGPSSRALNGRAVSPRCVLQSIGREQADRGRQRFGWMFCTHLCRCHPRVSILSVCSLLSTRQHVCCNETGGLLQHIHNKQAAVHNKQPTLL